MQIRKYSKHITGEGDNSVEVLKDAYKALRGNISIGKQGFNKQNITLGLVPDNIDCNFAKVTTPVPNTEFTVTHNLNRVPIGFIVIRVDEAAEFWDSGTAWTDTKIFLECSANAAHATIMIF